MMKTEELQQNGKRKGFMPVIVSREDIVVQEISDPRFGSKVRLYSTYFLLLLPGFFAGLQLGFGNIALPAHQEENAQIKLDMEVGSWFVSLLSIFIMFGSLSSSLLASSMGRRGCLLTGSLLVTAGLILLHFAPSYHYLLFGRVLAGLGSGVALPTSYLFLHETGMPAHRAILATLNILAVNLGSLFVYIIGWVLPFKWVPGVSTIPSVVFSLLVMVAAPPSAAYMVQHDREDEALAHLHRLWGDRQMARTEVKALHTHLAPDAENKPSDRKANIKGLLHAVALMLIQSFSGCDTVYNYTMLIAKMANLDINSNLLSIVLALGFVFGFLLAPILVTRLQRKPHFLLSSLILSLVLLLLGLGMSKGSFIKVDPQLEYILFQIIPVVMALTYSFFYGLGLGSLPFTMLSELLPDSVRNFGLSLATFTRYASVFGLLKLFPAMTDLIGLHGLFWFHSGCCLLGALYVQMLIQETNLFRGEEEPKKREDIA